MFDFKSVKKLICFEFTYFVDSAHHSVHKIPISEPEEESSSRFFLLPPRLLKYVFPVWETKMLEL